MRAINWNAIEDPMDLTVWNRVTANFWLPEKIAISNDLPSWNTISAEEKQLTMRVFAGLTLLDTLQATAGAPAMIHTAKTMHEEAVFTNFSFMESVHAKSYSSIFSTLASTDEINEVFEWAENNPELQRKANVVGQIYDEIDGMHGELAELTAKAASVLLESFLFYSGFYLPFHYASKGKLTNTATIIRLILRDEGVHGFYIGYKFQQERNKLSAEYKQAVDFVVNRLLNELMENELRYTQNLYDEVGWTENVKQYLRYNANKAMMNLGYDAPYTANVEPSILASMAVDANETHDFFSDSGASYTIGTAEETTDDDWA